MGYIGAKNLKQISKNAKFIKKLQRLDFMRVWYSVEMTQKQLITSYDLKSNQNIFNNDFSNIVFANTQFFKAGLDLYNNNKLEEAKFKFEQDIVFNPKNEMSYLYLAKIFKNMEKRKLEEQN